MSPLWNTSLLWTQCHVSWGLVTFWEKENVCIVGSLVVLWNWTFGQAGGGKKGKKSWKISGWVQVSANYLLFNPLICLKGKNILCLCSAVITLESINLTKLFKQRIKLSCITPTMEHWVLQKHSKHISADPDPPPPCTCMCVFCWTDKACAYSSSSTKV